MSPLRSGVALLLGGAGLVSLSSCADVEAASLDELPQLTLVEELRIGSVSDPDVGFSEIGGVQVDAAGNVYVLENREREIRVYSGAGESLRTIGGSGDGPGELRAGVGPVPLFGILGDSLIVIDRGAARISVFSLAGDLLDDYRIGSSIVQVPPGVAFTVRPGPLLGPNLYLGSWTIPGGSMSTIASSPEPVMVPVVRMRSDGTIVDTIRREAVRVGSTREMTVAGKRASVPQPPDMRPLYDDSPRGTFSVIRNVPDASDEDATVRIVRLGVDRDTLFDRSFTYAPKPWSRAAARELVTIQLRLWLNRAGPAADTTAAADAIIAEMKLPPSQTPISAITVGDDDVLWMKREADPSLPAEWVLIDPDGAPIGIVSPPPGVTFHWSGGETVWAAATDDFGVPWLVRYRLGWN
jgi:hypothetical protein